MVQLGNGKIDSLEGSEQGERWQKLWEVMAYVFEKRAKVGVVLQ